MHFLLKRRAIWSRLFFLLAFVPGSTLLGQSTYDLVLQGGHVIDPKNGIDDVRDVAIKDHKIAAVAEHIQPGPGAKVVDVSGLFVTPGLVDIHVHVYAGTGERHAYAGDHSLYPDGFTLRTGVTTGVDAGSSGWRNFPDFKDRVIDRSITRILAFLNIVGNGMRAGGYEQNLADMDANAAAQQARKFPQVIVGIKTAHYDGPEWTPVEHAVQAGTIANIPVMVDFGTFRSERPYQELVMKKLRPGDISTHMYLDDVPMLDANGKVEPYLFAARKRGVIFDVGHGGGSFLFRQAAPAVSQSFIPDSISTDLHNDSMNAGMKDMLNVMSKFLNLGIPLSDVIRMSTSNPAHEIKHDELGNLSVGSDGDVAVLRLEKGQFGFVDTNGARMEGSEKLSCELTVRDGRVVWDLNGITREDWKHLGHYRQQGNSVWDRTIIEPVATVLASGRPTAASSGVGLFDQGTSDLLWTQGPSPSKDQKEKSHAEEPSGCPILCSSYAGQTLHSQAGELLENIARRLKGFRGLACRVLAICAEATSFEVTGVALLMDAAGEFAKAYSPEAGVGYLIRPDGYLGYHASLLTEQGFSVPLPRSLDAVTTTAVQDTMVSKRS